MKPLPLRRLRGWFARKGISPQRQVYSRSVWGTRKSDVGNLAGGRRKSAARTEPWEHGQSPGCDAWPIHVVLHELGRGRGLGFAHFNDGECRCLLEGAHTNRDGVEICPERTKLLLEGSIGRLTGASDQRIRERFLLGLPCPRCHGVQAEDVLRRFPELRHHHRVPATLFHHAIHWSRSQLSASLVARGGDAFLVCSTEHEVGAIEGLMGLKFRSVLTVDRFRAHDRPEVFDAWADTIGWGGGGTESATAPKTLLLLCGIMGRVWAIQSFLSEPESVTLCLGSYFDDVSLGRVLKYAGGQRLRCGRCLRMG